MQAPRRPHLLSLKSSLVVVLILAAFGWANSVQQSPDPAWRWRGWPLGWQLETYSVPLSPDGFVVFDLVPVGSRWDETANLLLSREGLDNRGLEAWRA